MKDFSEGSTILQNPSGRFSLYCPICGENLIGRTRDGDDTEVVLKSHLVKDCKSPDAKAELQKRRKTAKMSRTELLRKHFPEFYPKSDPGRALMALAENLVKPPVITNGNGDEPQVA